VEDGIGPLGRASLQRHPQLDEILAASEERRPYTLTLVLTLALTLTLTLALTLAPTPRRFQP